VAKRVNDHQRPLALEQVAIDFLAGSASFGGIKIVDYAGER
jgi:hypothetical protein